MIAVVQSNGNIGVAQRFSGLCSRENNILHAGTTQLLDALFSQHPSYRVRNVTLTAAVRSYDTGDSVVELKYDLIGKWFEPVDLNTF